MALSENATLEEIVNEIDRLNKLIVNRGGAQTITPKTTNQVLSKGNYKGNITIKGDANLISSNILKGKSIFGVSGNIVTGGRWAEGTVADFGMSGSWYNKTVPMNLSFTPTRVIMYVDHGYVETNGRGIKRFSVDSKYCYSSTTAMQNFYNFEIIHRFWIYLTSISNTSFTIASVIPHSSGYGGVLAGIKWFAFEEVSTLEVDHNIDDNMYEVKQLGTKIYFCKDTGNVLLCIGDREGYIEESTFEQDIQKFPILSEYGTDNIEILEFDYGVYPEISKGSIDVKIDLDTKQPIFTYIDKLNLNLQDLEQEVL